jgi:predicted  nucleic acid-binding Zn-ribbon protein
MSYYDVEHELRRERNQLEDSLRQSRDTINRLHAEIRALVRYNEALEKQLEPSVVAEIRDELNAQDAPQNNKRTDVC